MDEQITTAKHGMANTPLTAVQKRAQAKGVKAALRTMYLRRLTDDRDRLTEIAANESDQTTRRSYSASRMWDVLGTLHGYLEDEHNQEMADVVEEIRTLFYECTFFSSKAHYEEMQHLAKQKDTEH